MTVAVIMAGGFGRRLAGLAKPLLAVCGVRLIDYALELSRIVADKVVIATRSGLELGIKGGVDVEAIDVGGGGYVADLSTILAIVHRRPVVVVPADICILDVKQLARRVEYWLNSCSKVDTVTFTVGGEPFGMSIVCRGPPISRWVDVAVDGMIIEIDDFNSLGVAQIVCCSKKAWGKRTPRSTRL